MPAADPTAAPAPASARKPVGNRRLLLLAFTVALGFIFGALAIAAFAAWTRGTIGNAAALLLGLLLAWVLPLVLSVRATMALKRQGRPVILRRLTQFFLVVVTQLTVFLVGFTQLGEGTATPTGELAAALRPALGNTPILGGILIKAARDGGADDGSTVATPTTPGVDGGVVVAADGGVVDGVVVDGGPGAQPLVATAAGLSPRTAGRMIQTVVAAVTTTDGDLAAVRFGLAFGGQVTTSTIELTAFADKGSPTRVEASSDGHTAIVLAGQYVVTANPTATTAELAVEISRGGKLAELEIQGVRDLAVGPGGNLLVVVDAFDSKKNKVVQALVSKPVGAAAFVVRRAGDVVDPPRDPKDKKAVGTISHGYAIKRNDGTGGVVVEEIMLEGGNDVGEKLAGTSFVMNPRRLLVGRVDAPRALAELARTGEEVSGIDGVTIQGFADAVALVDGRVVFDANFVEEGPRGWLFQSRVGGGAFAVTPELVGKPEAAFGDHAPRTPQLSIEADGAVAFVNKDGGLVLAALSRMGESKVVLVRAEAIAAAGKVGGISRVVSPCLAPGGEWVFADVEVLNDSGVRQEAVVLASRADLAAGKAEVLLVEGGVVPGADAGTPAKERRIKSIFFLEGHTEALWGL